ncbi:hypothetical protein [Kluyvera ascorbata]|jgi:hypothetical protein|uniref:Uncharacterized protein n=1 Tax=Kluyvera ascorbata TaxID=51288 RepID=A0A3N2RTW5_9ENTR|nr:hypothetical protein [Kluyvera ascorbata]BBV64302.1 hypothetical protein STW0522KLE44_06900 [Klebsiella sp. STW0522-44]HEB4872607.1 hypothetical protein [Kluyvera ascorbata F0526]EJG2387616.1 hypothetical protein [Kluyvera ascorbata]KFD07855.1 hypothetical protein GKAS_00749 [Kluyvera ascorbata ATCC 33433]MDT8699745.1 hypothetical protein [Kluyvera ascorbata]
MSTITANSISEANELISSGKYKEIILDFDIDADSFFTLATAPHDIKITLTDRNNHAAETAE